jgi:hypothetical protein
MPQKETGIPDPARAGEDMPGKLLGLTNRNTFAIQKRKNSHAN